MHSKLRMVFCVKPTNVSISRQVDSVLSERVYSDVCGSYSVRITEYNNGVFEITNARGKLIARYDPKFNETRDEHGLLLSQGNSLIHILISDID